MRGSLIIFAALCTVGVYCTDVSTTCTSSGVSKSTEENNRTKATNVDTQRIEEFLKSMKPPSWDYKKLEEVADVIVIATLRESAARPNADYRDETVDRHSREENSYVSIESRFDVRAVLKGNGVGRQLSLAHLNWKPNVCVFGVTQLATFHKEIEIPWLISVEVEGKTTRISAGSDVTEHLIPEYLLFLKRRGDGMYDLASGQRYAAASVRTINLFVP